MKTANVQQSVLPVVSSADNHQAIQNGAISSNQSAAAHNLPILSTVKNLPGYFRSAGLTEAAIRGHIFKAEDRIDSKGRKIPGNGLAATGAIIHRGRKRLLDVPKYGEWLAGRDEGSTK